MMNKRMKFSNLLFKLAILVMTQWCQASMCRWQKRR